MRRPAVVLAPGDVLGRLTMLFRVPAGRNGYAWWTLCECGTVSRKLAGNLRRGLVRSCGCREGRRVEIPTYAGAHTRVKIARGRASEHTCSCGGPATDWAYDWGDPDELIGSKNGSTGLAYSLDPAHYSAMCRPCHLTFDANRP